MSAVVKRLPGRGPAGPLSLCLLLAAPTSVCPAPPAGVTGAITVIGTGPERRVIERLARAFEKAYLGTAIEIRWNRNFHAAQMLQAGEADVAVSAQEYPGLTATQIAWDGIAVIVNFTNPVTEVTSQQVAQLFSGRIANWSALHERGAGNVELIRRPADQHLNEGFERALGINGQIPKAATVIRSDQRVLRRVSGRIGAVSYLSLRAALDATEYGTPIKILLIDGVEAGHPTVRNGQYPLRRPVFLLLGKQPIPVAEAFVRFAVSREGQRILQESFTPLSP